MYFFDLFTHSLTHSITLSLSLWLAACSTNFSLSLAPGPPGPLGSSAPWPCSVCLLPFLVLSSPFSFYLLSLHAHMFLLVNRLFGNVCVWTFCTRERAPEVCVSVRLLCGFLVCGPKTCNVSRQEVKGLAQCLLGPVRFFPMSTDSAHVLSECGSRRFPVGADSLLAQVRFWLSFT